MAREVRAAQRGRSGIAVLGDQRGAATRGLDGDARADLAVSQKRHPNAALPKHQWAAGIRVRLDGGAANPLGIGAQLRVMAGARGGPVREVRFGSGYLVDGWCSDRAGAPGCCGLAWCGGLR